VRFVQADLFDWRPDQRYDAVFMGFWLSHVPWSRFTAFWEFLDSCLLPGGQVLFVDDAHRTEEELVEGAASSTVERRLADGTPHRAIKVPHEPGQLQYEIRRLGWDATVHATRGPFYWGACQIRSAQATVGG